MFATRVIVVIEVIGSFTELCKRYREVAARLAYAVFQEHTMTEVSHAAGLLFEELQAGHQSTLQTKNLPIFGSRRAAVLPAPEPGVPGSPLSPFGP